MARKQTKQIPESQKKPGSIESESKQKPSRQLSREAMEAEVMFRGYGHAGEASKYLGCDSGAATMQVFDDTAEMLARMREGDLSDVEKILAQQLVLMHSATLNASAWYRGTTRLPQRKVALQAMTETSRATRQIAAAIANIKKPKRFTVIEKQQNVMVNGAESSGSNQLGESTNAPMDTGSQGAATAVDARAKTLA